MIDTQKEAAPSPAEQELRGFSEDIQQNGGSIDMYRRLVQIADTASERVATMARDLQSRVVESFAKRPESIGVLSAAFLSMFLATSAADAQERKELPRVLHIVVPFAAGGPSDVVARTLAESLKRQIPELNAIVENRPGAGGAIAAGTVARATPDGSRVLFMNNGMPLGQLTNANFPADADPRKMVPAGLINSGGLVLVASKDFPGSSVDEFLQWVIDNKKFMAHGGIGSPSYICTLQILARAKAPIDLVPYTGAGQALQGMYQGDTSGLCALTADSLQHIASGNVKAVALTQPTPGITAQTFAQQGHPSVDAAVTNALAFPQGTPQDIVDQITKALIAVRQEPQFAADSIRFGLSVIPVGDGETVLKAQQDMARWYLDQLTQLSALLKTPVPEQK